MQQKKIAVIVLFFSLTFCLCQDLSLQNETLVNNYFLALNESNLIKASTYLSDSITMLEGDFILTKSIKDFQIHFLWDSVFEPHYEIIELTTLDENMEAIISKTCKRIKFLHDSAIVYKVSIDFDGKKISRMETFDYKVFDFAKWQAMRDTLIIWVDKNHPELSGFHTNQTSKGAEDYLEAIELFKTANKQGD